MCHGLFVICAVDKFDNGATECFVFCAIVWLIICTMCLVGFLCARCYVLVCYLWPGWFIFCAMD